MALTNLTTPGVYVQEIPSLASSVVAVPTAIPAFIGYTEKGPLNTPVRIESLVEYEAAFGGPFRELYSIAIASDSAITVTPVSITSPSNAASPYTLYHHLVMYFANGGGTCYIISAGNYDLSASDLIDKDAIIAALAYAEEVDEVTLLVVPEALNVDSLTPNPDIKAIYDAMLIQCNKLKDRFAVMDVKSTGVPATDATNFRNFNVGANYLNYGAAYYPHLVTLLNRAYSDDEVIISGDARSGPPAFTYATAPNNRLSTLFGGIGGERLITIASVPEAGDNETLTIKIGNGTSSTEVILKAGIDFPDDTLPATTEADVAAAIVSAINSHPVLSLIARAQMNTTTVAGDDFYIVARTGGTTTNGVAFTATTTTAWTTPASATFDFGSDNSQDIGLYNSIKTAIAAKSGLTLPPAATMVGIYAAVDGDRGVWKAPANVGVTNISGPSLLVTEGQQGGLNVDATSGKSINVIRTFTGRGTIVWGARTLEGNSNEWRYVPVRRLFIMVEESCKKASEFVVFEPNDKGTWLKTKGMISNFLNDLWKQGALAGATPEDAYFVRVGLGETMTAQDILEGKMIVSIGIAAVRPAEFIVLQFMHKLQES
jgi:phage tail sheath protein FI